MTYTPLSAREWLEDMLRFSSRDADRARELLEMLAECEGNEQLLEEYGERVGDLDEAFLAISEHEAIGQLAEQDELVQQFGGTLLEQFQETAKYAKTLEAERWEIRELLRRAGVLGEYDETTDIVPLLQMFLPS